MRSELGVERSGLERLIRGRLRAARPGQLFHRRHGQGGDGPHAAGGGTAYDAAGRVHGDIQRAFVRAEVIAWNELVDAGGYAAARERGTLRVEGREYVVQDGDVVHIRT